VLGVRRFIQSDCQRSVPLVLRDLSKAKRRHGLGPTLEGPAKPFLETRRTYIAKSVQQACLKGKPVERTSEDLQLPCGCPVYLAAPEQKLWDLPADYLVIITAAICQSIRTCRVLQGLSTPHPRPLCRSARLLATTPTDYQRLLARARAISLSPALKLQTPHLPQARLKHHKIGSC